MKRLAHMALALLFAAGVQLGIAVAPVCAQLDADPASLPIPSIFEKDPGRAVVVTVMFNAATDVVLQNVTVANVRAPGAISAPPLIKLELRDQSGEMISEQNAWHPLWARDWGDDETTESGNVLPSGIGTFYVPLSEDLTSVRIRDIVRDMDLIEVDVEDEVSDYCTGHPVLVICGGTGVPTSTSTTSMPIQPTTTTTTTLPGGACGDPVGDGAAAGTRSSIVTASDALFVLSAGVGLQSCELCLCDVNGSGSITATDALATLNLAVGLPADLSCPPCN